MKFPAIYPVACHTNNIGPGSTFVAIKGTKEDGVRYIPEALARGATTVVVQEHAYIPEATQILIKQHGVHVESVENTRLALAQLSATAAGYPAHKLRIVGITGTKGKTTSAFLLEHLLRTAGYKTALLGTVKNSIMDHNLGVELTTQQPDYLHQFFKLCVDAGVEYVVMEVAAQGLTLHRAHGIEFDAILFTNFSQEHGEFYATQEEYFAAKCAIFDQLKVDGSAVINSDDAWCAQVLAHHPNSTTFGIVDAAANRASVGADIGRRIHLKGMCQGMAYEVECPALIGMFNAYNVLGVLTVALKLGVELSVIAQALKTFTKVPGRLERHGLPNGATCIIDYAHNPSSFDSVLSTLRQLTGQLIVVFGCGGDRDKTKRPVMGAIAAARADLVVLTSDNPRSENPQEIITDIMAGIDATVQEKVVCIVDRKEAIEFACSKSKAGAIIALLGKGPDEYQIVGGVKTYFSESNIVHEFGQSFLGKE